MDLGEGAFAQVLAQSQRLLPRPLSFHLLQEACF